MNRFFITLAFLVAVSILYGQQTLVLKNGRLYEGAVVSTDDNFVVFSTLINNKPRDLQIEKTKIREIRDNGKVSYNGGKEVSLRLNGGTKVTGTLIGETSDELILIDVEEPPMDTLILSKSQIASFGDPKNMYFDIGFLRGGGALVGVDVEFPVGNRASLFVGGGFVAYGAGLNLFFKENHKGLGLKLSYNHQGIGDTYVGSLLAGSLFYKARKGISADLGIARVVDVSQRIDQPYQMNNVILYYGIGYRF